MRINGNNVNSYKMFRRQNLEPDQLASCLVPAGFPRNRGEVDGQLATSILPGSKASAPATKYPHPHKIPGDSCDKRLDPGKFQMSARCFVETQP